MNDISVAADELDALGERIAETAATIDATTHRLLTDLRTFDVAEAWYRQGLLSCAHWLNWRCGISLGPAREKVRVARALADLPAIDEQLRLGQLSYAKVRALTRVATADNEVKLIELARGGTASQLEKICRLYRQVQSGPRGKQEPERWMRVRDTDDGMVRIELQLHTEEAARLLQACDASAESRPDGIVALAEAALRGDHADRPPVEVLLHIDAATLEGCTGATGVPAETSRRLLCDAGVVPVLTDAQGTPLDVGRKTRTISAPLRRALLVRDRGCRFPGCTRKRHLDAHHIEHWIDGGETTLGNTALLCSRHHALVHEGGFAISTDGENLRFFTSAGRELDPGGGPATRPIRPMPVSNLPPVWDGDRPDYRAAIDCLT